jgi:hypothetical protein
MGIDLGIDDKFTWHSRADAELRKDILELLLNHGAVVNDCDDGAHSSVLEFAMKTIWPEDIKTECVNLLRAAGARTKAEAEAARALAETNKQPSFLDDEPSGDTEIVAASHNPPTEQKMNVSSVSVSSILMCRYKS